LVFIEEIKEHQRFRAVSAKSLCGSSGLRAFARLRRTVVRRVAVGGAAYASNLRAPQEL
jgi:hypothetical protein